ncbi:MAG TPA: chromosomal replication initiator protein DnaA [Chloroflexota bacterium]|nr:chromosomal replication initiator protein DnaA [Chloroflexota bacterium]
MNAKQIWQAALGEMQVQMSRPNFETWLRQAAAVSVDESRFVLRAHSTFAAEYLERRLRPQIEQTLSHVIGRPIELEVIVGHAPRAGAPPPAEETRESKLWQEPPIVAPAPAVTRTPRSAAASVAVREIPAAPPPLPPARRAEVMSPMLTAWQPNPNYTFETFTVGKSNQAAHAAAMSVAEDPGRGYNPLFIYGGVGLGKTHLLHAIANVVVRSGSRTLYVPAEDFTNDLVNAIREHRTDDFRLRYRTIEVLLVDDVQFIAGKEATQEEFFHTFNALHNVGHQIVLTSDRPPKAIANLAERLQSRFAWGIAIDVQLPDLETRRAILQAKAAFQQVDVPEAVIDFLASAIQSNIRELEGALNRVVAYSRLMNQALSVNMARAAIEDLVQSAQKRLLSPSDVVDAVCRYYRIEPRALKGKERVKEVVLPRQVAMFLMRQRTQSSLVDIGRELGGRDHSTVLHGCDRIQSEAQADVQLRRDLDSIDEMLRQSAIGAR